jgi:hypothetical protein
MNINRHPICPTFIPDDVTKIVFCLVSFLLELKKRGSYISQKGDLCQTIMMGRFIVHWMGNRVIAAIRGGPATILERLYVPILMAYATATSKLVGPIEEIAKIYPVYNL